MWQEFEHLRAKAARQAELLERAEEARVEAEEDRARMEAKFMLSDKGTALLEAARLKLELEACRNRLAQLESHVRMRRLLCFHEDFLRASKVLQSCKTCSSCCAALLSRLHV